jgi:hypothetical protein
MENSSYKTHYNIKSKGLADGNLFVFACIIEGDGGELGVH